MSKLEEIAAAVEKGRLKDIEALVAAALDEGLEPGVILSDGMIATMGVIGDRFQRSEIFIPEMLVAAMTMKKGMGVLRPRLAGDGGKKHGKFIVGTVAGDIHDIGKNLVALMVESAGFEVVDLGVDIAPDKFIDAIRQNPDCRVVGLSSLLTTTMGSMRETVDAIISAGLKQQVKILVGGAPITREFAEKIGADGYAADAAAAAAKARELATA